MAPEIERKFLLDQLSAELEQSPSTEIEQGYLTIGKGAEVRVRRCGENFGLTLKRGAGEEREETEVDVYVGPLVDKAAQFTALAKT